MPIYEYGCDGCGHQFETSQKMSEAPLKTCPACGKELLQKLISSTAFVLKGSGWYKDGYGSKDKSPRTENQRGERLEKAIADDKKKTAAKESTPASGSSSTSSTDSGGSSGSTSSGGSTGGSGGGSGGDKSGASARAS